MVEFSNILYIKTQPFSLKICAEFALQKLSLFFQQKIQAHLILCVPENLSVTNDFIKLTML